MYTAYNRYTAFMLWGVFYLGFREIYRQLISASQYILELVYTVRCDMTCFPVMHKNVLPFADPIWVPLILNNAPTHLANVFAHAKMHGTICFGAVQFWKSMSTPLCHTNSLLRGKKKLMCGNEQKSLHAWVWMSPPSDVRWDCAEFERVPWPKNRLENTALAHR